jgi:hypothetical protein
MRCSRKCDKYPVGYIAVLAFQRKLEDLELAKSCPNRESNNTNFRHLKRESECRPKHIDIFYRDAMLKYSTK